MHFKQNHLEYHIIEQIAQTINKIAILKDLIINILTKVIIHSSTGIVREQTKRRVFD